MNYGKNKMYGGKKKMTAGGKKKAQAGLGAMALSKLKKLAAEATTAAKKAYYERQILKKMREDPNYGEHEGSKDLADKMKKRAGGKKKMGMGGDYMEPSKELTFGGATKKMRDSAAPENPAPENSETFGQAFAKARKELGPGKTFMYKGKKYSTNRADDKPKAAPKALVKKTATAVKSGTKKPGLQTSKPIAVTAEKSKKAMREDRRMDRKSTTRADRIRGKADKVEARMEDRRNRKAGRKAKRAKVKEAKAALKSARKMRPGGLKEVPEGNKGKGLSKLPTNVRNKMGYMKDGGKKMMGMGGKKKAQLGGMFAGAIGGAKGAEGGLGKKLMGAAKGALGGSLLGRGIGAVKGAMGGGGLKGAMQGAASGAFGNSNPMGQQEEQMMYGGKKKMKRGGKKKMTAGGIGRAQRLAAKAKSADIKANKMAPKVVGSGVGSKKDVALEKQRAKANKARARANRAKRGKV